MRNVAIWTVVMVFPLVLAAAGNQTIVLKNGNQFHGTMINGSPNSITFQDDNGDNHRFDTSEVQSINFSGANSGFSNDNNSGFNNGNRSNPSPNNNSGFGNNSGYNANRNANSNNNSSGNGGFGRTNNSNNRTLASGTELAVRTNEAIDSSTSTDGRTYSASIAQDVVDSNGNVVIPKGSDAQLVVKSATGGGVAGSSSLTLDLQSVMVNGQRFMVNTADVTQAGRQGIGQNRRTAEITGGGTALGTLLGAIGGGGKGALIGALAGAAAGAGVQVLTRGSQVKVPAETILNFRLDQPMQLSPANY